MLDGRPSVRELLPASIQEGLPRDLLRVQGTVHRFLEKE